ncbi:unnamed protein product [Arabidopsis thaliana]|uniref:Uncharacterized protein n=1 Tax=Arabidopsis thaliana TaxID=3702 RepID=A0A5S9X052_ARATH|nr:unnamed protein product [Arabidopsis thaliana]
MALLDTFRFTQESITQLSSPIQRMCTQRSSSSSTTESTTNTIPTKKLRQGGFIYSNLNTECRYFNPHRCSQRRQPDTFSMENSVCLELTSSLLKP